MPKSARLDLSALDALAVRQHGCVTLAQLESIGMRSSTVAHRTRPQGGTWSRLLPGVVLLHRGTPTTDELTSAAMLYGGSGCVLTGLEALRRHGLRRTPVASQIHLLVPHAHRRLSVGYLVAERTRRMPDSRVIGSFPCAPVARAVVDASRRLERLDDVRAMAAEAVQRRMCPQQELIDEIRLGQRRRTARIRVVGAEIVDGIRSAAEGDVRQVLHEEGFPPALWNHDLFTPAGEFIGCPDAWFDDAGVALEIDSREWHLDPQSWERTQIKRARFARFGVTSIPVTPQRVHRQRREFVNDLACALESGLRRPRPDVRAVLRSQAA